MSIYHTPAPKRSKTSSALAKGTEVFEKNHKAKHQTSKMKKKITKYQPHIKISARSEELKTYHKTIRPLKTWNLYLSTKLN